jgi:nitrite reductase/ring-hydroxylating ferredoxin subunit
MWHEVARLDDLCAGGMKDVRVGAHEVCLCEYGGSVYAVSRRCGHQNVPLDQGALDGWVLTCPLHDAQFDIRSGMNLSRPIDHDMGSAPLPEPVERWFKLENRLQQMIRVHDLDTYPVQCRAGSIEIDVPETA